MAKNAGRLLKINDEIQKELSRIIRGELKDPRIGAITSVVRVDTTSDLSYCTANISVFGDDAQKKEVMNGLAAASGFIRRLIAERINLRVTPEFRFVLDGSIEYGDKISRILKEIVKEDGGE